ncbi:MAG: response regulator transcription factor [Coriobacteriales bacterium]|nr:response regulator transcription factor [Coriobacteriales bacterium]
MFTIYIVEDDKAMRDELLLLLQRNGYLTKSSTNFANIVTDVLAATPDLLLLDLTLPTIDGQLVCEQIRKLSSMPIIVVTSRDDNMNELLALNHGADDFIAKPYDPQILLAHIAAALRRAYAERLEAPLVCNNVSLDLLRSEVSFNGKCAQLTKNELRILALLIKNNGRIVSRANLQNDLWQSDEFIDDNTLTVNVNRLRTTLASIGVSDDFLLTRRGLGYMVQGDDKQ